MRLKFFVLHSPWLLCDFSRSGRVRTASQGPDQSQNVPKILTICLLHSLSTLYFALEQASQLFRSA